MKKASRARVPIKERFWQKVEKSSGCWHWTGCKDRHGYGQLRRTAADGERRGAAVLAHRAAWELTRGDIPPGMFVLHHCDTPSCVRPTHLFLGSQRDNMVDMLVKRRDVGNRRLTTAQVSSARAALAAGATQASIAAKFGVHHSTISYLARGKTWSGR